MTTQTNTMNALNTKQPALLSTREDVKTALLLASMTINLFMFTAWLVIQTDPRLALILLTS
ncbi:MAG: hypothetical protein ABIR46_04510 [Candidatus Saccharimonadales bacterium]